MVLSTPSVNMAEQDEAPAADTLPCCTAVSLPLSLHSHPPHVVSVFGVCLFGVVLIANACVFGLCWLGGEHARCRADGVPSAPCGPAVPSTLLSHRERRADRLLQGEHHFLPPPLPLSRTHREAASSSHISFFPPNPPCPQHLSPRFSFSLPAFFTRLHFFPPFLKRHIFSNINFRDRFEWF